MYERNAIVLERYFNKIFNFDSESNLRANYYNYRELFECYGVLCDAKEREKKCNEEFNSISDEILRLQETQEKLYDKGAKYEYSRSIIFGNIEEDVEKIEKHLNKVVEDVSKNNEELKELGIKFVEAVISYNNKNELLKDAISQRIKAQEEYDKIYSKSKKCYEGILEETLNQARDFINSDNKDFKKGLQETFEENGKKEKNQFDPDVISNTINKSVDIYKVELDVYLAGFDRIEKLFEEIETDSVKTDKHTKYYRDSDAKMKFMSAEKDYIVQFLDNERIGAIYDKKVHRKLMLEACKKFVLDFEQIDKLYDIILKEIAGRSTKKIYKENYNKEYLLELENVSVEPSLDTGRMRQEAIAFMNLNYWRASGMRSVYESFEEIATTIYEKDLTEFLPEEVKETETSEENLDDNVQVSQEPEQDVVSEKVLENQVLEETKVEKKAPSRVYYSSKKQLAKAIFYSLQNHEFAGLNEDDPLEEPEDNLDEQYSIPENVEEILKNIDNEEEEQIVSQEIEEVQEPVIEEGEEFDLSGLDDIEYEEDDISAEEVEKLDEINDVDESEDFEANSEEDSILEIYFNDGNDEEDKSKAEDNTKTKVQNLSKKFGLFHKLVGLNSRKKKEEV